MNFFTYRISLDIRETTSQAFINVKKNDTARKFIFTLTDNGRAYQITEGCTAVFRAKKPDGTILYNNCPIVGNAMEYYLTSQTVAAVGIVECEITLYGSNSKQITSPRFSLAVDDVLYSDSEVESKDEFTALTGAIEEVRALKAFTIKLTTTSDGITADKTFTEIAEKVNAAKSVIVNMDGWVFPVSYSADSGKIVFSSLWANIAEIPNTVTFAVNSSDVWNVVVSDIPTTAQVSAKYTKPASGIPKADLANDVQASLDKAETALQEHQSLAAYRTSADQDVIDGSKQDKLIAGENITIAEDGKTISAAGKANVLGYFRATFTGQSVEDFTLGKTFAQVKEEIANNNKIMLVDNFDYDCVYTMTYNGNSTVVFAGMVEDAGAWVIFSVTSDDKWHLDIQSRVTFDNHLELSNRVGATLNLTTTDKTNLVAAVNEVKQTTDNKQDKLIAGENITIAADGKTISAKGGGGSSVPKPLTYDYMPEGYPTKTVQATTLMEQQEIAFALANGVYRANLPNASEIVVDQTYAVSWDGTEYECTAFVFAGEGIALGNLSIIGNGDDTGEPFLYGYNAEESVGRYFTHSTSATHTISVKWTEEAITPMAYDFMPAGYPSKSGQIATLMEEQALVFTSRSDGKYSAISPNPLAIAEGKTYMVNWDGIEYKCVCFVAYSDPMLGNLSIMGEGEDTGEPFIYICYTDETNTRFYTLDTSATHTISVKEVETIIPMSEEFLPPINVPTKTSQLENDAGYLTLATLPKYEGVVE